MKIYSINIRQFLLFLLSISANIASAGQISNLDIDTNSVKNYQEKLVVRTDRNIYLTGEMIWLKVYKMNALTGTPSDVSKVVYLELLDSLNNPVSQLKIPVFGASGSTGFRLSDTISSGNYLMRAYTKWMLNYSENQFFYKTLTIINPFKNIENLPVHPVSGNGGTGLSVRIENNSVQGKINNERGDLFNIKVEPDKEEYLKRERVKLNISVTTDSGDPVVADMSVSIIKRSLFSTGNLNYQNELRTISSAEYFKADSNFKVLDNRLVSYLDDRNERNRVRLSMGLLPAYLPEIEGQLITGTIRNKTSNEPVKNTDISLSFVGKTARCQFVKTNDKGEFYFVVNDHYGISELVIQPLIREISDCYVDLPQPFCNTFNEIKPGMFFLDSSKMESINNAIVSMQINNIYDPYRQGSHLTSINTAKYDFFGKSDRGVKMSDYITLTNIREVVKEILPDLILVKKNKRYSFRIVNNYPFQPFENQALILVDGVPVYDVENLLNVSSKDIEKIDIITTRYYFSENTFDGIISFVTKRGDLSALGNDNSVYRQVFDGYQHQYDYYSPDYSSDSLKISHIPDFRNTLFWKPDLKSSVDGTASVEFYTSDEPGEYLILVEGLSSDGKTGFKSIPLLVK